jgi:hypothetical protein
MELTIIPESGQGNYYCPQYVRTLDGGSVRVQLY